jgi:hypothetical protein
VFTNAQVIAQARDTDARLSRVEALLVAIASSLAAAPVSATATLVASAPIVAAPALAREATPKAVFTCIAHATPTTPACVREFGKAESLAAHNAWAHKA